MKILIGLKLILLAIVGSANTLALTGNTEAGQASYAVCIVCHGERGEGNPAQRGPALAGQDEMYLARQLKHFKNGIRGGQASDTFGGQMRAMASTLADDQAIADVAAYITAMATTVAVGTATGDVSKGAYIYQGSCQPCHMAAGEGKPAVSAPRLAGLGSVYLIRQLTSFKAGLRGRHAEDVYGRQMREMAKAIRSGEDVANLAAYIHSLL